MSQMKLTIKTKSNKYSIIIGSNIVQKLSKNFKL